jgi:CMP-N,N'-diacetyllegionaminic acid synthase
VRVLGVIPARGGSKGVPRKNIRPLCGKPLLAWTAEAALAASCLDRVVLSTEDEEIAEVGRGLGLEVPFMRPAELAEDTTPTLPVLQHVLRSLEDRGDTYDAVCLLQPTHPLRPSAWIDGCVALFEASDADSVFTTVAVPVEYNPHWLYLARPDGTLYVSTGVDAPIPRRQDLPAAFRREGSVYVTLTTVILEQNSLYGSRTFGHPVPSEFSVNIDTPTDLARAQELMAARLAPSF